MITGQNLGAPQVAFGAIGAMAAMPASETTPVVNALQTLEKQIEEALAHQNTLDIRLSDVILNLPNPDVKNAESACPPRCNLENALATLQERMASLLRRQQSMIQGIRL